MHNEHEQMNNEHENICIAELNRLAGYATRDLTIYRTYDNATATATNTIKH
jgi:hypothetical protein